MVIAEEGLPKRVSTYDRLWERFWKSLISPLWSEEWEQNGLSSTLEVTREKSNFYQLLNSSPMTIK